jgi:hypothetical protein
LFSSLSLSSSDSARDLRKSGPDKGCSSARGNGKCKFLVGRGHGWLMPRRRSLSGAWD